MTDLAGGGASTTAAVAGLAENGNRGVLHCRSDRRDGGHGKREFRGSYEGAHDRSLLGRILRLTAFTQQSRRSIIVENANWEPNRVHLRHRRSAYSGLMRIALVIVGVVVALFGLLWALQGFGVVGGSPMSNTTTWSIIGPIVALIGIAIAIGAARRRKP